MFNKKFIQEQLNKFNAKLKVDGVIGNYTLFWLHGLQYAGGLKIDGIYGNKTHNYAMSIVFTKHENTKHFHQSEFKCHCCGKNIGIDINVIILLEAIRYYYKEKIIIVSGYRCPKHNAAVGGAKNSQHLYGRAADIKVSGILPNEVRKLAEKYNVNGGVGSPDYKTFTHCDCRGRKSRW